jgi:hypothetical protein
LLSRPAGAFGGNRDIAPEGVPDKHGAPKQQIVYPDKRASRTPKKTELGYETFGIGERKNTGYESLPLMSRVVEEDLLLEADEAREEDNISLRHCASVRLEALADREFAEPSSSLVAQRPRTVLFST